MLERKKREERRGNKGLKITFPITIQYPPIPRNANKTQTESDLLEDDGCPERDKTRFQSVKGGER
jgi:hypothetical protein